MENVFLCIIYVSSLHVIFPRFSPWCSFRDGKIEIRILICWNMLEPLIFLLNTSSLFCLHMFIQVIRLLQMFRPPFQLNPWTFPHSPPFLLTKSVSNPMDVSCFSSLSQDFPENPMGFQNFTSNFPRFPPFFHAFFSVTSRRQGTHGHQGIHGFGPTEATRDGLEERQGGGPEDRTGLRPLLTNEKTHSRSC